MHASWDIAALLLILAVLLDWLVGEYPTPLHPVVWMGHLINFLLRLGPRPSGADLHKGLHIVPDTPAPHTTRIAWWLEFLFGMLLVAVVCLVVAAFTLLATWCASGHYLAAIVVGALLLKSSFALRALGRAASAVTQPLEQNDLPTARQALRALCSRDPTELMPNELLAGTVESLAENLSDSFVAPIFYYLLFGLPGALVYRAINTMDAMIGYRGKYEALGKTAARLDDVVNWLPARVTALLLLLAGCMLGQNVRRGWHMLTRDGGKTPSPNAGRPMAVMAGLLGVQLEKKGVYVLGDADHELSPRTVRLAWSLVVAAASLMLVGSLAFFGLAYSSRFWYLPT